ncbi:uncharacterized protein JN550_009915 [Neoarthrinium moseri]|uniref:uncharacterized protein n=1 Tax=Neoarthrinium moseri TaxID=1658444 RepID=UPI001FDD811C|nr:uncharacterized protein JN550_009915 [Neoarthrinium moseri]KAI1862768.1 hypothetical protein JN550_009915 [Neoarthrinium moseri]
MPCNWIASGDAIPKSGQDRDRIAEGAGVIGFELKRMRVWDDFACASDYAHIDKVKAWQQYAAATAVACGKAFLDFWVPLLPNAQHPARVPDSLSPEFSAE